MNRSLKNSLALGLALIPLAGWAGSGVLGGTFNSLGVGTRPMGMGGAFVAVADDANASIENPAGMAFFDKEAKYASFTHASLFSLGQISRDYLAYAQADTAGFGALGLAWNRFTANLDPENWTEDAFSYSGAKALSKGEGAKMSLGWILKYMRVDSGLSASTDNLTVGGGTASGYGIGVSMMMRLRPSLTVGIAANDIYSSLAWATGTLEILPPSARGGFAYKVTDRTLVAAEVRGQQASQGFGLSSWHLGAEQWFFDGKELMWDVIRNLGVRGGYYQLTQNSDAGVLSVGATAKADEWQIDYAYQFGLAAQSLGATHRFGIRVNF